MAKENKVEQSLEDEALGQLNKLEAFVQKNSQLVYGIAAVIVLGAAAYFFYKDKAETDELDAQKEIFTAQYFYAMDSVDIVLNGDGNSVTGVEEIAEDYSSTQAGNLAKFYSGVLYLKKGEFELAIDYLKEFSSSDLLIQARSYSLIADAYMELAEYEEAISYYEKASDYHPNEAFTPKYLIKLAIAYEKEGDPKSAFETYNKILSEFPKSAEANNAKKYSALLATSI